MKYITERLRSHDTFSSEQSTDLEKTMAGVSAHPVPAWTFIYSLKRGDAAQLG